MGRGGGEGGDERRYVCPVCRKTYLHASSLSRHVRTHTSEAMPTRDVTRDTPQRGGGDDGEVYEEGEILRRYSSAIESYHRRRPVVDVVNVELLNGDNRDIIRGALERVWEETSHRFKINASHGCVLEHKETGRLRYFHSSSNNAVVIQHPALIMSLPDLERFQRLVLDDDPTERALQRRPNTRWKVRLITNVTFYVYKMLDNTRVGCPVRLPPYLRSRRGVCKGRRAREGQAEDNLCFFRCLAKSLACRCGGECRCLGKRCSEKRARRLFTTYCGLSEREDSTVEGFEGVGLDDLLLLELIFNLKISVVELEPDGRCLYRWYSRRSSGHRLVLNLYKEHFMLVTDLDRFATTFGCRRCGQSFTRNYALSIHSCALAEERRRRFVGGGYGPPKNIFRLVEETLGRRVTKRFYPYRITYDIEVYLADEDLPASTEKVRYTARHELLSISVCSNVPGHREARCFIRQRGEEAGRCVGRFVDALYEIADEASRLMREVHAPLLEEVRRVERERRLVEEEFGVECGDAIDDERSVSANLCRWLDVIPVIGFNSQRYDLNVLKPFLMRDLLQRGDVRGGEEEDSIRFVIKRDNKMSCVMTSRLKFLDVIAFIAPGFSLDKYLRAYGCSEQKGFFPYEWVRSLDALDSPCLPPREAFDNSLKDTVMSIEDYEYCQRVWRDENMQTFADFLRWYNNLDVVPLLEALQKQCDVYQERGIDAFKDAVSLPGLAVHWKFGYVENRQNGLRLLSKRDEELYSLIKTNIIGGPSIIFCRYHEKGVTRLRSDVYGDEGRLCQTLLGVDANALYLYCMMQEMPSGAPRVWEAAEDGWYKERPKTGNSKTAMGWLAHCQSVNPRTIIHHEGNGKEVRLGKRRLPVDGFCIDTNTAFQFHGCYYHGHGCIVRADRQSVEAAREKLEETLSNDRYIRALGYTLVTQWECQWRDSVEACGRIKGFLRGFFADNYPRRKSFDMARLLEDVRAGTFFGMIECDIRVPDELSSRFSEMAPIFKHARVGRDQAGERMKRWLEANDSLARPQPALIGSTFGKKILLLSPLLGWYLEHGLIVDNTYRVVEFLGDKTFARFGESVSEARRQGDADPDKQLLAETSKLVGNACYGKLITNKDSHRNVSYIDSHEEASERLGRASFESLTELAVDEPLYELTEYKKKVIMDAPTHAGFAVLQYAKLRMLQFYYDFMDRFVDRRDFQYMEMDTDSAYMALSGSLESVIRPEMREEFYTSYGEWFPRLACPQHQEEFVRVKLARHSGGADWCPPPCCVAIKRHDRRTPGLFKVEFEGDGMVALNSKTYFCWSDNGESKHSCKGLNKHTNRLTADIYKRVLFDESSFTGVNRGFILRDNVMHTYDCMRTGLTYSYVKRVVLEDGINTKNIEL